MSCGEGLLRAWVALLAAGLLVNLVLDSRLPKRTPNKHAKRKWS
jgi:hypothetical protein